MASSSADGHGIAKHGDMRDYLGPSLFQPHQARQALRDAHEGKIPPMLGYFAALASVPNTRWIAPIGYDAVWIDMEHSAMNVETMTTMVHDTIFMSGGKTIPFVRVPDHNHAAISYAMDAGASIIFPQVETVEQATRVVAATKYGTAAGGTRSAPPARLYPGLHDQPLHPQLGLHCSLNRQAAVMIQIESLQGIRNLDAILEAVPDIDAVFLGQLDARVSMNLPGGFGMPAHEPEWKAAVAEFLRVVRKHDKPLAGAAIGPVGGLGEEAKGLCLAWISFDAIALMGLQERLVGAREAIGDGK